MGDKKQCIHSYSKSMNEPRPRLCIHCKEPEICLACLGNDSIHMCGKERVQKFKLKKGPVDLAYFKEYVESYQKGNYMNDKNTFIKDIIYGIGLAVSVDDEYKMADGYNLFLKYLAKEII